MILDRGHQDHRRQAVKSRFCAFGRNWDFAGKSAEICQIDWKGP